MQTKLQCCEKQNKCITKHNSGQYILLTLYYCVQAWLGENILIPCWHLGRALLVSMRHGGQLTNLKKELKHASCHAISRTHKYTLLWHVRDRVDSCFQFSQGASSVLPSARPPTRRGSPASWGNSQSLPIGNDRQKMEPERDNFPQEF